jgi:LysM repeat protein
MTATLQILDPEGRPRAVAFVAPQMTIGRALDNHVVLDHAAGGVSSHHCVIGLDPAQNFVIQDRGSTNGTWIGERKVEGMFPLRPGMRIAVGGYQIILELPMAQVRSATIGGAGPRMPLAPVSGPLLAKSEEELAYRRFRDSVARAAAEWERKNRPGNLLLARKELERAEALHDGEHAQPFEDVEVSYIRASRAGLERDRIIKLGSIVTGSVAVLGFGLWLVFSDGDVEASQDASAQVSETPEGKGKGKGTKDDTIKPIIKTPPPPDDDSVVPKKEWIEHVVIPAETLDDIARRYGVSIQNVSRWNGVGESEVLEPGKIIKVKADNPPLPWQQISYQPETSESWSSLAKRFDVPVDKLRAYNPAIGEKITSSDELTIWITPTPLKRRENVEIPAFTVRPDAISIGAPHDGKIENAIQFPENEALYRRRAPNIMWCGSYMAENLQRAIATFRYTYEFEGDIVVADMSKKTGGQFDPHKSHQAGRDVDVWLPTLKGVYKRDHLEKERRPYPDEVDWFALYGFLKAIKETKSVHAVVLAWELHEKVYNAAKLMGASDEELHEMITWPRGPNSREALLQHSDGHYRHMHIRFKCGPNDVDCSNTVRAHDAGD